MTSLAERFAESNGQPQEVDGVLVQAIYRRSVSQGQVVRVRRVQATAAPTQGLRLKLDHGFVVIDGHRYEDVVLWADTAPADVELVCETGEVSSAQLRAWNCWKNDDGVMHAWLGDAGMVVDDKADYGQRVTIRCGDGTHSFSPRDLEIELFF